MFKLAVLITALFALSPLLFANAPANTSPCYSNYKLDFDVDESDQELVTEFLSSAHYESSELAVVQWVLELGAARPVHFNLQVNADEHMNKSRACSIAGNVTLEIYLMGKTAISIDSQDCNLFDSVTALAERYGVAPGNCPSGNQ